MSIPSLGPSHLHGNGLICGGHAGGGQLYGHGTPPRGPAPNPMMRSPGRGSPMHPTAAPTHRQPGHGASSAGHYTVPHTHPHTWTHAAHGPPHPAAHVHPGGAPAGHAAQKPSHKKAAIAAGAATGTVAGVAGATYFNSSNTIVENNNNEFETVEYPNGDEPDAYGYSDEYNVNDGYGYDGDRNEGQYYNNGNYAGQDPAYNDYTGDSADVVSGGNEGPNSSGPAPFDGYNEPSNVTTGTGNKENGASDDNDGCCGDCCECECGDGCCNCCGGREDGCCVVM